MFQAARWNEPLDRSNINNGRNTPEIGIHNTQAYR
jgi:hypothetical protein